MSGTPKEFYSAKLEKYSAGLKTVSQKIRRFAWYRFAAFILIFIPLFIWGTDNVFTPVISVIALILFLILVKINAGLDKKRKKFIELKKLAEDEILALNHSFSHFENGEEFIDTNHFFSYDLDIFGEGSLFQFLNRTSTFAGRKLLAGWLTHPLKEKKIIEERQKAVEELSLIPNWRIHFLANGKLFVETEQLDNEIRSWSAEKIPLKNVSKIKWLIRLLPAITVLSAIPAVAGITNLYLMVAVFIQWLFLYFFWKRVTHYYNYFGRKTELLSKYMQLLRFIEEREFFSDYLTGLQKKVTAPELSSEVFGQLKKLIQKFEYRNNILVGVFLNSFLLWDIRIVYLLWKWHRKNHEKLAAWIDVISEFDALISLANYADNNREFVFPEIHEGGFAFDAKQLGHPLLHPEKRVCNNLEINGWSKVVIVTGANMAGKSTFLRTVGVNLILGRTGAPVCAEKFTLTPIAIYTNMRTTDSLIKDESYFFAELKRIKAVLDRLQNGERVFVILDEMLKGTNSVDKLNGSKELIRKLIEFKSVSLIATHDLKLAEMEHEFPQIVFNKCFEIKIENNEMIFDYKLSDGVTKTMNATFLMKKMGII